MSSDEKKSYVCQIKPAQKRKLEAYLKERGFEFREIDHADFGAKGKGLSVAMYKSGKLVVQGKSTEEFVQFYLEPEILGTVSFGYEEVLQTENLDERIGVDESGKGDYFGPLVIGSVYSDGSGIKSLKSFGVKDCKKLTIKKVLEIDEKIRKKFKYSVVTIGPERYNALYEKMGNMNRLLAWGHARAIENLLYKVKCRKVIVDQFCKKTLVLDSLMKRGKRVDIEQRHHAEEDIVVAAASVVARAEFLKRMQALSEEIKVELPRGASKLVDETACA
ncbi:MAG: ribonuclease HIII, partial [Candidatus Theseobacter exili]|nr:ribonuclease HIII [Candidatus Theseobacter exili]